MANESDNSVRALFNEAAELADAAERAAFVPAANAALEQLFRYAVVGGPATVRTGVTDFLRATGVDELMTTAMIFDQAARLRSFEILAALRESG